MLYKFEIYIGKPLPCYKCSPYTQKIVPMLIPSYGPSYTAWVKKGHEDMMKTYVIKNITTQDGRDRFDLAFRIIRVVLA